METHSLYFFIYLTEALCLLQYTDRLFCPKYSRTAKWAVLACFYFLLFFLSFLKYYVLNFTAFFTVNFLFIITMYQSKWYQALFHSAILITAMNMSELAVIYLIPDFFNKQSFFYNLLILAIPSKVIYFLSTNILSRLFRKKDTGLAPLNKVSFFLFAASDILVLLGFILILLYTNSILSPVIRGIISFCSILLFALNFLIFFIHDENQRKQKEFAQLQLQAQKEHDLLEYYQMLSQQNETRHILIHDMKKHLASISLLNEENKNERIAEYLDHIIKMPELKGSHFCSNELLNAILSRYQNLCAEKQISFCTDIDSSMDFLSEYDLTRLFGNLLDNALEAAMQVPGSFIDLRTSHQEDTSFLVITLVNSCKNDPFHGKKNARPATGKPDKANHGYGLKSVQKVVETHHGNLKMYYTPETQSFHTVILLKDKAGNLQPGRQLP